MVTRRFGSWVTQLPGQLEVGVAHHTEAHEAAGFVAAPFGKSSRGPKERNFYAVGRNSTSKSLLATDCSTTAIELELDRAHFRRSR